MNKKKVYLALCIIGTLLPLWQFTLFFMEEGADAGLFIGQIFANHASSGIALDALVTGLVVIAFILAEGTRLKMKRLWAPISCIFLVGMSLALPLFLYMRETAIRD